MAPQHFDETPAAPEGEEQTAKQVVVVVGNGMVGHRFLERLKRYDTSNCFSLVSIGEEPIQHYNRMLLTEYFEHLSVEKLKLATSPEWYEENEIALKISSRATSIDVGSKTVLCQVSDNPSGDEDTVNVNTKQFSVSYDHLVIATGATALVPTIKGSSLKGVFVYRTIQDLDDIIAYGKAQREREQPGTSTKKYALVIGGGLLGLEAAKAIHDLKVSVRIVNRGSRLMSRQLDDAGAKVLHNEITTKFGIQVLYHKSTKSIQGETDVEGATFTDGSALDDVFMIVFATGIKPRDDLAHVSGLEVAMRGGGIQVNDYLETSAGAVYAIGECVSHRDVTYGLVAPGYEMADSLAKNLTNGGNSSVERVAFTGSDSSTKLKLMGIEVAAFGTYFPEDITEPFEELVYNNPLEKVYKKLIFSANGKKLLGGILVGDASDFPRLTLMCKMKDQKPLTDAPNEILLGKRDAKGGAGSAILDLPDEAQVCSCNNVTKGDMCSSIRDQKLSTLAEVKKVCNVGTGCGGCMPMVKDLLEAELAAAGTAIDKSLCEHFAYSRQELYQIVLVEKYETFTELLTKHGRNPGNPRQHGCEICKPTVASIFASLMNHHVLLGDRAELQDTNDRFLANIQKSGQFSIVPRVAGGEITPDKLIVLGKVAKKYNLYSKITGGQRIDLFGAEKYDLPDIWQELVDVGFESGHAYGKSLRTVKSCVGSTWCRFGQQDAVGFAIFLEDRYKGVRSPHKIKGGVSGCTRECAEARGKDFGCIATEKGYNVYVCGNGGTNPKHAVLLAPDVPQELCVKYLDRFLMYYIRTADRLQRTSKWLESLEGGIEQLRRVVLDDSLGIAATLEKQMAYLLNTYECEWKKVVETPELRAQFAQFRNTSATQQETLMVEQRGQLFPVGKTAPKRHVRAPSFDDESSKHSKSGASAGQTLDSPTSISDVRLEATLEWIPFGAKELFDVNSGGAVLYGETQIAVFNITELYNGIECVSWFATQNMCPHDHAFVLAQGILGDADGRPKVVCPMHKKSYDLVDGSCMSGDGALRLETFRVKVDAHDGLLYLLLPPSGELDARLGTSNFLGHQQHQDQSTAAPSKPTAVAPLASGGVCGGDKRFDW